jgi:hypothetical protein
MNFNPYAAPQALAHAPGPGPGAPSDPQPWEVGEVFRAAWELFKPNWGPLCAGVFVAGFIGMLPQQVPTVLQVAGVLPEDSTLLRALAVVTAIIAWLLREFFAAGFTRACLGTVRTGTTRFGDLFGAGGRYVPYVIASLVTTLATAFGFVLLIVPGVILALGLWMTGFFLLDRGLDPIAAIRASWEASRGQKGAFFVLALAELGVIILGFSACCVGFFAASMVALLARTVVYLRVAGLAPGTYADIYRNPS